MNDTVSPSAPKRRGNTATSEQKGMQVNDRQRSVQAPTRRIGFVAAATLAALLCMVFVSSASALSQRPFKETFGSAAQPTFEWPSVIAVDKGSGDVLVGDYFGESLTRYHADGTPAPFAALGSNKIDGKEANGKPCSEEPASCDQTPQNGIGIGIGGGNQIAIDESGGPTDGDIYLSVASSKLVDVFSAEGKYLGQITRTGDREIDAVSGVAVDASGAVYVSNYFNISKFVPSGNPVVNADYVGDLPMPSGQAGSLVVGSGPAAGSLFVTVESEGKGWVLQLDKATGQLEYKFGDNPERLIAVDPNTHTVILGSGSEYEVSTGSPPVRVSRLLPENDRIRGIDVNGSSEAIVIEELFSPLSVYGTPATVPTVTADPASEVIGTKASLSGTVNPSGLPVTDCYFEYGTTSSYDTQVPCEGSIPTDSEPHPVHADLSGLEPNGQTYHFRLVALNENGREESEDQTFTTLDTVVVEPATALGDTTATLNGTLRPEGDQYTACFFEYGLSTSATFEKSVPCQPSAGGIPADFSPHPVKAQIGGLQSGRTYRFRLVATNSSGTIKTEELTFNSFGVPVIREVAASDAGQNAVSLEAKIDPSGFGTSYRIEWGPTSAYGNVTPAEFEPFLGSGNDPVQVRSRLTGLSAGSTYHYRVVATSSRGVTQSADHVAETLNGCGLPEGRCFEIVSRREAGPIAVPGESNAAVEMHFQAATGGAGGLAYPVEGGYPEATKGADVQYRALRDESGWDSTQLSPPILALNERPDAVSVSSSTKFLSDDLSCGFTESWQPLTSDPSMKLVRELGGTNLYRINPDGSYTGVTYLAPTNAKDTEASYDVTAASDDCGKVVFGSRLTYSGIPGAGEFRLYEWDEGSLRNVGVVPGPSGEVAVPAESGAQGGTTLDNVTNTVSDDGSRVFFTAERQTSPNPAEVGSRAIFVRENGSVTRDLSLSQTGTPAGDARWQWATADGSTVFFTANAGLTDESSSEGTDLYEYDLETEELTDRSVVSAEGGADVAGILGISADGSQVYFASRNQLIPGSGNSRAQNVKADSYSIYGGKGDQLSFVGTFNQKELLAVLQNVTSAVTSQVSPDGRYLIFQSSAKVTGYDSAGLREVYLYDAEGGSDGTTCVSCRQDGQPSPDERYGYPQYSLLQRDVPLQNELHAPQFLTIRNGEPQVFFSSPDVLAPGAVAGQNNVYEWSHHQVFRLVSAQKGTQSYPYPGQYAVFAGASEDSSDVYVVTPETLNWEDGDQRLSAYDARIGGGFAQPPAPPAPCDATVEGSCQGAAQGGPAVPGAGSATFSGPGNPKEKSPKKKHKKKKHKKHKGKKKNGKGKKTRNANGNGRTGK